MGNRIINRIKILLDLDIIIMNIILIKIIMLNIYSMISRKDLIINRIQILFYQIKSRSKIALYYLCLNSKIYRIKNKIIKIK